METTIIATQFIPPRGRKIETKLNDIAEDDVAYIKEYDIAVSFERLPNGEVAFYFDDGKTVNDDPDEDPDEIIIIRSPSTKPAEFIASGVEICKQRKIESFPYKIQIVDLDDNIIYDQYEDIPHQQREQTRTVLRPEIANKPKLEGLLGPMWGGWYNRHDEILDLTNDKDPDSTVASYCRSRGPVAYFIVRYETLEAHEALSA